MFGKRSQKICHYCGGVHPQGQCPLFMPPPMMPPMYPPAAPPMMPPMHGGMNGGMHCGDMMMPGMHEMMQHHTHLLEHIATRVDQIYDIVASMHMGGAKG